MSDAIGDREITYRRVLKIAIPILLANVTIPILGAVDTAVVGQIPDAAPIAAVGVGAVMATYSVSSLSLLRTQPFEPH